MSYKVMFIVFHRYLRQMKMITLGLKFPLKNLMQDSYCYSKPIVISCFGNQLVWALKEESMIKNRIIPLTL